MSDHLMKVNRVPGGRLPIGYHFRAGWYARQAEIDEANSFIQSMADGFKESDAIACKCIRGECVNKIGGAAQ